MLSVKEQVNLFTWFHNVMDTEEHKKVCSEKCPCHQIRQERTALQQRWGIKTSC